MTNDQLAPGTRVRITRVTPHGRSVWTGQVLSIIGEVGFMLAKDGAETTAMTSDEGFAEYVRKTWKVNAHQTTEILA